MVFYHTLDPVFLRLGFLEVRWYGLFFVMGFVIAYFMIQYLAKLKKVHLTKEDVSDYLVYLALGALIGSRLFYVAIYNPGFYLAHPEEVFALWRGGLSFHGGFVGCLAAMLLFSKKKNVHFWTLADLTTFPLAIGLFFGRMGNFINGELFGRVTNLPWGVKFQGVEGFRHPSQLYEAGKNFFLFLSLWGVRKKEYPPGSYAVFFIIGYSVLRFLIEFVREPDSQLGFVLYGLTMGQVLNILMLVLGVCILVYLKRKYIKE